jgi:hypothetical protein
MRRREPTNSGTDSGNWEILLQVKKIMKKTNSTTFYCAYGSMKVLKKYL